MRKQSQMIIWFWLSVGCVGLSSFSLAFIHFADFGGSPQQKTIGFLIGAVFWLGLIAGYILLWFINKYRKEHIAKSKKRWRKRKPGIISFFQSFYGMIADVLCLLSFDAALISAILADKKPGWLTYFLIAFFIFSLQMHGILNGENFRYISLLINKSGGSSNG